MLSEQALNKRNWEGKEDALLLELHSAYGPNWTRIAGGMGIRSAKQCRERYTQHLKPGLNRSPISEEEGRQIMRMVSECGQRWAQIARNLGTNRSDNQIKNWWNGAKRKETSKRQETNQDQNQHYGQDLSPSPGLAALPERHGILPPGPLDLPFIQDNNASTASAAFDAARFRSSSARSESSERPPSLVSDNGSSWSISQPASVSGSPTTAFSGSSLLDLPPLLFPLPAPTSPGNYPGPGLLLNSHNNNNDTRGFGPVRRSSAAGPLRGGNTPASPHHESTAPATPVGRPSSRWEPYSVAGRRPSMERPREYEKENGSKDKGSLSFLLN